MIPKSGNRFSEKIMLKPKTRQATCVCGDAETSGSVSQTTWLRPLRFAA